MVKRIIRLNPQFWLFRVKVTGESLWPVLVPGQYYWASSLVCPRPGRIVVFHDPADTERFLVKKITRQEGQSFILEGTVSWSSSYRARENAILGCVII